MPEINKSLIDFEDEIRLGAITVEEALKIPKEKQAFVIGEGIKDYLEVLRGYGFKDLWQVLYTENSKVQALYKGMSHLPHQRGGNALLMYSYVDYVLNHTEADIVIFLPKKSRLIEDSVLSGPTHDEIIRALEHFPDKYQRIHFVVGLFDLKPEELEEENK